MRRTQAAEIASIQILVAAQGPEVGLGHFTRAKLTDCRAEHLSELAARLVRWEPGEKKGCEWVLGETGGLVKAAHRAQDVLNESGPIHSAFIISGAGGH